MVFWENMHHMAGSHFENSLQCSNVLKGSHSNFQFFMKMEAKTEKFSLEIVL